MGILLFCAGILVGLIAARTLFGRIARPPSATTGSLPADRSAHASAETTGLPATDTAHSPQETAKDLLYRLKQEVESQDDRIHHPGDLTALESFRAGVELLAGPDFSMDAVCEYLSGSGYILPSMAAVALSRRPDDTCPERVLKDIARVRGYPLLFILDYLQSQPDAAALALLLRYINEYWWEFDLLRHRFRDYLRWAAAHPADAPAQGLEELEECALEELKRTLVRFDEPALAPFLPPIEAALAAHRERRVLGGFGRVRTMPQAGARFTYPEMEQRLARLQQRFTDGDRSSVLVSGEHGVGKTALIDVLTDRLRDQGWLIFEASAAEILAGQSYIGQLEERIREMLGVLNRPKVLWRAPDFYDLLHKGSYKQDPRGILDLVLPAVERAELRVIGEITPRQLAQLLTARPALKQYFEIVTVQPPDQATIDDLAAQWAALHADRLGRPVIDTATLTEAMHIAAQYFPEQHDPGRSLRLLDETLRTALKAEPPALPLGNAALLAAVAARSGLPLNVIDDQQSLDLDRLRDFFRARVLGQDEAIDCLVDRIAMLKAGLIDTARPIGVFLFAGPTGTGKTELAKALGELLFGSSERLLRLDMSEFQSDNAGWRLTGDEEGSVRSLTARIREQPFSVVLLDEFEKAHPMVWDLFLQVFDDARLSDRNGNTADFRHSIIIMTSNAGATISRSAGPGFTATGGGYSRASVEKVLYQTFRREFLNRIDRVVLFNPLDRSLMREILYKELDRVLTRRGLRNRDWAVEWEPSAIEFLLDRGFTPDLGARPLRRAIEHYLLAPLARSIVEHRAPEGDQFLFIHGAGDRLDVRFVDPDVTESMPVTATVAEGTAQIDLRGLMLAPAATAEAIGELDAALAGLRERTEADAWNASRDADFAQMAVQDFWNRPDRFRILDRIERRDRIESALDTAARLRGRLRHEGGDAEFIARLAQLLFLLDLAIDAIEQMRPQDAVITLRVGEAEQKRQGSDVRAWWQQLVSMYLAWAERRNMRVQITHQDPITCQARLAVSGFGAFALLEDESGLHVLEQEQEGHPAQRISIQVQVVPDLPGRMQSDTLEQSKTHRIARRYRVSPSPLVRDSVRGWRSGRLDRILAGDFDIIGGG